MRNYHRINYYRNIREKFSLFLILIFTLVIVSQLACQEKYEAKKKIIPTSEGDITEVTLKKDTLQLLCGVRYLYYPFGRFKTIDQLKMSLKNFTFHTGRRDDAELDTAEYRDSKIIFVYDDGDHRSMEIVNGIIKDNDCGLLLGMKVGMKKKELIYKFIKEIDEGDYKSIKVLELISVVDGMWHYYTIEADTVKSIEFVTDRVFDDK